MKKKIKNNQFIQTALVFTSFITPACGVTKATISKPAEGTSTTITITTNNPMTTNVSPNVELNNRKEN